MLDFLDFHKLFVLLINYILFWLIVTVLIHGRKDRKTPVFILMSISMSLWVTFAYLARIVDSSEISILFLKIAWFATPVFFWLVYVFTGLLLNVYTKHKTLNNINIAVTIVCSLFAVTPGVIAGTRQVDNLLAIVYGNLMIPYILGAAILIFTTLYVVVNSVSKTKSKDNNVTKTYICGLLFFYVLNLIFNIALPINFQITRFYFFGDYSTALFTLLIAYAIMKYNFLGAKVLISSMILSILGVLLLVDILILSHSVDEQIVKSFLFIFYVFLGVILQRSITNEVKQKEALAKSNRALELSKQKYLDLANEQKDIIDVMGHEIRTPLTVIAQEIRVHNKYTLIHEQVLLKESQQLKHLSMATPLFIDTIKTIDKACGNAVNLVTDMLETARLDKGRFQLNYEKFNLYKVLIECVEIMKRSIDELEDISTFDFRVICRRGKKAIVNADKNRIKQAINALLSNAIKYKDIEKEIVRIRLELVIDKKDVKIYITDNGIGIANEDITKLGKKFVRLNNKQGGSLTRPGGTGLGLFVVNGIMKHHGGELIIESEGHGKGSTFILHFPVNLKGKEE